MKDVFLVGDLHGMFDAFLAKVESFDLRNADIIQVGDFGLGFQSKTLDMASLLEIDEVLGERGCRLYAIRGNHDNPEWWKSDLAVACSNISLMPDFSRMQRKNKKILFVGGGVSIDRHTRVMNVGWWPDEEVPDCPPRLGAADILISHSCPSDFNVSTKTLINNYKWYCDRDSSLIEDCRRERRVLNEIVRKAKPSRIYYGHFHNSLSEKVGGILGRCINELEFLELR